MALFRAQTFAKEKQQDGWKLQEALEFTVSKIRISLSIAESTYPGIFRTENISRNVAKSIHLAETAALWVSQCSDSETDYDSKVMHVAIVMCRRLHDIRSITRRLSKATCSLCTWSSRRSMSNRKETEHATPC